MGTMVEGDRKVRKQYYLSAAHISRIEEIRHEIGVRSDAEVIRQAIETFDPHAPSHLEATLAAEATESMLEQIDTLKTRIDETLARAAAERERVNDPAWAESIRERTRAQAVQHPALVEGIASLIGADAR